MITNGQSVKRVIARNCDANDGHVEQQVISIAGTGDEGNTKFHSIACKLCRHLHLFCDKTLPSCSECSNRGKACCYETPKKRGRPVVSSSKTKSSNKCSNSSNSSGSNGSEVDEDAIIKKSQDSELRKYHPYYSNGQNEIVNILKKRDLVGIDDNLIRNNCKLETIDFFYKVIDPGFSLISQMEMKLKLNEITEDSRESTGFLSMMYSIQALCEQRLANCKRAESAANESRRYLSKTDYNIYAKIGYVILSDYYGGEGEDEIAKSYLDHLNRILGDVTPAFEHLLITSRQSCTLEDRGCNGIMSNIVFIFTFFNQEQHTFDLKSFEEGINPQNAGIAITLVHQVKDLMDSVLSNQSKSYTESYNKKKHLLHDIIFISGVSSIFFSLGLEGEIVDTLVDKGDQIMKAIDPVAFPISVFPHVAIFISYRVHRFMNILAEFQLHLLNGMDIRSIFSLEKFQKYFNGIVLCLKSMNEFTKRYKRISKQFGRLHQGLLAIAKWKFDVQSQIIPNALVDDLGSSTTTAETVQSPFIPESPVNTSTIESLYKSCLERAKLNHAFHI